ncbi:MAG: hypothetical protein R8K20_03740 [Gallionellaceae bacterium]
MDDGADALAAIGLQGDTPDELFYLVLQRSLTAGGGGRCRYTAAAFATSHRHRED